MIDFLRHPRFRSAVPWLLLAGLSVAVYAGSFRGPFIFDDFTIINDNQFMRQLWPPAAAMEAPFRSTAAGRPVVAYSFAINYAISGLEVWSYHAFNLVVHLLNVLLLYGILRGVGREKRVIDLLGSVAVERRWSLLIAALWAVHPLNSETVVYISQRTELLMALFFLGAFACLLRAHRSRGLVWPLLAVVCGVLATLCKETAVVLPVLLLLFDRAFLSGSFAVAWRRHAVLYAGSLVVFVVAVMIATGGHRGGLITDDAGVTWRYLLTQGAVILEYLRLSVIPHPLAVTYEWPLVSGLGEGWPAASVVFALLVASGWAVVRRPALGFLGAGFFLILGPTSSVIPIMTEVVAERRMYLPSIIVLIAIGLLARAVVRWGTQPERREAWRGAALGFMVAALAAGSVITVYRVRDYQSRERLWEQTLRVQPESLFARLNLAGALISKGQLDGAERLLQEVKLINPKFSNVDAALGLIYLRRKQYAAAADSFARATYREEPRAVDFAYAGFALAMQGKREPAAIALGKSLEMKPDNVLALNFVGSILSKDGKLEEAISYFRRVIDLYPEQTQVWTNLAHTLLLQGKVDEARAAYEEGYRRDPDAVPVLRNFANFEATHGRPERAIALYRHWLELDPHAEQAMMNLAMTLSVTPQAREADAAFQRLLVMRPRHIQGRIRYARWLLEQDRLSDAFRQAQAAREVEPENEAVAELTADLKAERQRFNEAASPRTPEAKPAVDHPPASGEDGS